MTTVNGDATPPLHRWMAMWPITDTTLTTTHLATEVLQDLHAVATRHGVHIHKVVRIARHDGRRFPGSGGAEQVITATCLVNTMRDVADHNERQRERKRTP